METVSITALHTWTPKLFSIRTTRPKGYRFTAGQWARLGVRNIARFEDDNKSCEPVWRAYSIVSSPYDDYLEFYSIVVPNGAFTSQLSKLQVGDTLQLDPQSFGFLTTARFQGGTDLWMLSTGTGLAPFLSILNDPSTWENYNTLILVHGVREANEQAYVREIAALQNVEHPIFGEHIAEGKQLIYVPVVSREPQFTGLRGRIPELIANGELEKKTAVTLDLAHSRIMICGNPEMVGDTRAVLKKRGFTVSRNAAPGQIAVENYW